jgi:hypothetical protein
MLTVPPIPVVSLRNTLRIVTTLLSSAAVLTRSVLSRLLEDVTFVRKSQDV